MNKNNDWAQIYIHHHIIGTPKYLLSCAVIQSAKQLAAVQCIK